MLLLTLALLAIPAAVVAGVIGLLVGARLGFDLPDAHRGWDTARLLVRLHLFEPLATLPWMALCYWIQGGLRFLPIGNALNALVITAPMLMLLSPWLPQARLTGQLRELGAALSVFGTARYAVTLLVWLSLLAGHSFPALFLLLWGTLLLWVNVLFLWRQLHFLAHGPGAVSSRRKRTHFYRTP